VAIFIARQSSAGGGGGGSLTDGGTTTINGSGFGTNVSVANQEWLGGVNGVIEGIANNTTWISVARTNWTFPGGHVQRITTLASLNGTKSLGNLNFSDASNYQFGTKFDTGGYRVCTVRVPVYVYNSANSTTGQVKFLRFVGGPIADDQGIDDDDVPNCYVSRFWNGIESNFAVNEGTPDLIGYIDPKVSGDIGFRGEWMEKQTTRAGDWYIFEFQFTAPSAAGVADGALRWRTYNATTGAVKSAGEVTSRAWWQSTSNAFRYLTLQGYMGNTLADGSEVYFDRDIYITWNTSGTTPPKYILLGDASTFAACTKLTTCRWTGSWSDTQITGVEVNKGYHSNLTGKYWYVMSAPGSPINSNGIAA